MLLTLSQRRHLQSWVDGLKQTCGLCKGRTLVVVEAPSGAPMAVLNEATAGLELDGKTLSVVVRCRGCGHVYLLDGGRVT
jgi:hypothetical protein